MSEMFSYGWSIFVAVVTTVSLAWCLWLLLVASKRREMAKDNTTGHVWDVDLRELNNPLPRWWFWLFVITVVFGAFYLVLYPGLGAFPGTLGWTSSGQYQTEQRRAQEAMAPLYAKLAATPFEQLAKDPQAMAIGERLFGNNCAGCHGANARGSTGFPNLTDGDWLYGGEPQTIIETITKGRTGTMPPMGEAVGTSDDVRNVAQYVLSLAGAPHDSARAIAGQAEVRRLCGLPRPRRQGQPCARRAQPDRQRLAARLRRGRDRAHGHAGQDQHHAALRRPAESRADPRAGRLRLEPVAKDRGSGQLRVRRLD